MAARNPGETDAYNMGVRKHTGQYIREEKDREEISSKR